MKAYINGVLCVLLSCESDCKYSFWACGNYWARLADIGKD